MKLVRLPFKKLVKWHVDEVASWLNDLALIPLLEASPKIILHEPI
jgi:hypothetical protein